MCSLSFLGLSTAGVQLREARHVVFFAQVVRDSILPRVKWRIVVVYVYN